MIEHHLEKLSSAGFTEVVINLGHLGSLIPKALGNRDRWELTLSYSTRPRSIETGGGLTKALLLGKEVFLVVNGSVWTDLDFAPSPNPCPR